MRDDLIVCSIWASASVTGRYWNRATGYAAVGGGPGGGDEQSAVELRTLLLVSCEHAFRNPRPLPKTFKVTDLKRGT